jgi:23S rRNA U2552 (ribose-2'-O)-methylase RlmE/FtsJ
MRFKKNISIFKSSQNILDLGSAPGSWSEYVSRNFKEKNLVAIDLLDMKKIKGVHFIKGISINWRIEVKYTLK